MSDQKEHLQDLRRQIDDVDDQLLELLNRRAHYVLEVGRVKKEQQASRFHVLEREESIYQRLARNNAGPFPSRAIRPIFREIISASLALEKTLQVAFLGPEATFSHIAAIQQFGESVEFIQTRGVPDIFDEVERERVDYGVVPIENSTEGVVNQTLDMFFESPLKICAEVLLEISQCLLSVEQDLQDIRRVYSHPQALAQCYAWLSKHLPHADLKESLSTAMAARTVCDERGSAAIAGEFAAARYGLPVLKKHIEDNLQNFTRFWVIGTQSPGRTGNDKTSLMMSIKDGVGALHSLLKPFGEQSINLTKIESRPFRKKPWEYIFFIDLEGHCDDDNVRAALRQVREAAEFMKVLGSYPKGSRLLQQ